MFSHPRPLTALAAALLALSLGGCTPKMLRDTAAETPLPPLAGVEDLQRFPQTIDPYLIRLQERNATLPVQQGYESTYYKVWDDAYTPEALEEVKWPFDVYRPENAYGQNLQPLSQAWFYAMLREANWQAYGSTAGRAVALRRLDLRNFPTEKPLFRDPSVAGEGFPFDYLQNSTVFAGEPLYISHYSRSGAWAYVMTSYATGWVPVDRIAPVGRAEREVLRAQPLLGLLEDRMPIHSLRGRYMFEGYVGMVLPLQQKSAAQWRVDPAGHAGTAEIRREAAAPLPLTFTRENMRRVIAPMMQTKYGWGGLYGERDCSSTLRDIFAPFGLWLPRNSYKQSRLGKVISFEGLDDAAKLAKIAAEGRPFETLLYLKGHILLYLGVYDGEPAVLHTVWGVKTVDDEGNFGRHIIGKTVISSLRLGHELEGYSDEYSLLHKVESMNFVFEEEEE
ncbi:SH3 domain-containing protein [Sulfurimonas diazotrophicus]|uniref:SH3 domain-containing protein n=1 Tax=Sulfurimonas diazotrophicus TaxID=3131939 RepID=A0ABZ3HCQ3_9BACT